MHAAEDEPGLVERLDPKEPFDVGQVLRAQFEKVVERAPRDDDASVHIKLAERKRRVDNQFPLGGAIRELCAEQRPGAVAEAMDLAVRSLDFEVALADQPSQETHERDSHRKRSRQSGPVGRARLPLRFVTKHLRAISSPGLGICTRPWFGPTLATMSGLRVFLCRFLR